MSKRNLKMADVRRFSLLFTALFCLIFGKTITSEPTHHHVFLRGVNVTLICHLKQQAAAVVWSHRNKTIFVHSRLERDSLIQEKDENRISVLDNKESIAKLVIEDIDYNDAGYYSCVGYLISEPTKSSNFMVEVQGYPRLAVEPNLSIENGTVHATCCFESSHNTNAVIIWLLGSRHFKQRRPTKRETENSLVTNYYNNLEIQATRDIDGDNLTCLVCNTFNVSTSVVVNVQYPGTVQLLTETLVAFYNNDKDVYITCETNGNPQPEVKLQKKGRKDQWDILQIKPTKSMSENNMIWKFNLGNTSDDVVGIYRCAAFNRMGVSSLSENVEVFYYTPKNYVTTVILVVIVFIIGVLVVMKVTRKKMLEKYDIHMDDARHFYSRHIHHLTESLRRCTASGRSLGNRTTLPDICSHESPAIASSEQAPASGYRGKGNTSAKTSSTLPNHPRRFGNMSLSGIEGDTISDRIYATPWQEKGSTMPGMGASEIVPIPQYATLSKTGNLIG